MVEYAQIYQRLHEVGYGKDWRVGGRRFKERILDKVPRKARFYDFGCGNGSSVAWLRAREYDATGIDIAEASGADYIIDISERPCNLRNLPRVQWGMAVDVMEHIPESRVPDTLQNIAEICENCLFHIAFDSSRDSERAGIELHVTRKTDDWWRKQIYDAGFNRIWDQRLTATSTTFWASI